MKTCEPAGIRAMRRERDFPRFGRFSDSLVAEPTGGLLGRFDQLGSLRLVVQLKLIDRSAVAQ
jgi:hypothetical protein